MRTAAYNLCVALFSLGFFSAILLIVGRVVNSLKQRRIEKLPESSRERQFRLTILKDQAEKWEEFLYYAEIIMVLSGILAVFTRL